MGRTDPHAQEFRENMVYLVELTSNRYSLARIIKLIVLPRRLKSLKARNKQRPGSTGKLPS